VGGHVDALEHFVGAKIFVQITYFQCGNQGIRSIFIRSLRIFQHFVCINSRFNGCSDTAFLYPNHISGKKKA